MLTLTTRSSRCRSVAIWSRTGETMWHGPHHSAQKSTITGCSLPSTSLSKSLVVTEVVIDLQTYTGTQMFRPLPRIPDHPEIEEEVLAWWDAEGVFDRIREQNRGGPKWSFVDGPVTA